MAILKLTKQMIVTLIPKISPQANFFKLFFIFKKTNLVK